MGDGKAVMDGLWTGSQGVLIGEEFAPWGSAAIASG